MQKQNFLSILLLSSILILSFSYVSAQELNIIELTPTDDAFVLADLQDTEDKQELRKFNSGNLDNLMVGYAINTNDTPNRNLSLSLLKFDLTDLSADQIDSATLQLYAVQLQLSEPQDIGVFLLNGSAWNESTLTYENMPSFSDLVTTTVLNSTNYYHWELGDIVKQNAGKQLSLMVSFVNLLPNTEDVVVFASKDSSPDYYPKLIINTSPINDNSNIVKITPTHDTFIGLDFTNPDDIYDLRNSNFGNNDFIKIWYSHNATSSQELITTSGLLQFDLSDIDVEDITSVNLKIKTLRVDSSGADKILSISKLNNTSWSESEITFANHPPFDLNDSFIAEMTQPDLWYDWDVTSIVKENTDSKLSLSISYDRTYPGHEEQTVFYSKESIFSPYLEITLKESTSDAEGGGCLIATATYGSELAPQVQALREIRDDYLLQTESGKSFMESFNTVYYSFSPHIADLERENPMFREIIKIGITPLLSSLSILNYVDMDSENTVLGYGIGIILMNVGMYFVAPAILFWGIKNHVKNN